MLQCGSWHPSGNLAPAKPNMIDTKPGDRMSRITRFLIPMSWTLWGILLLVLLWAFVDSIANPVYTPEVSPQVGPMMMGALLIVFVGFGLLLRWAARRRSSGCLIALTLMLAYVFFMLIATLVFEAWNDWQTLP
jgi:hypothetical protein